MVLPKQLPFAHRAKHASPKSRENGCSMHRHNHHRDDDSGWWRIARRAVSKMIVEREILIPGVCFDSSLILVGRLLIQWLLSQWAFLSLGTSYRIIGVELVPNSAISSASCKRLHLSFALHFIFCFAFNDRVGSLSNILCQIKESLVNVGNTKQAEGDFSLL